MITTGQLLRSSSTAPIGSTAAVCLQNLSVGSGGGTSGVNVWGNLDTISSAENGVLISNSDSVLISIESTSQGVEDANIHSG